MVFNFLLSNPVNSNYVKKKSAFERFLNCDKKNSALFHTFFYQFKEFVKFWLYYDLRSGFNAVKP